MISLKRTREMYSVGGSLESNDCAVRSAAVACAVTYDTAHAAFKSHGREDRRGTKLPTVTAALRELTGDGDLRMTRMNYRCTLGRFYEGKRDGFYVVWVAHHLIALVDGVVHDWGTSTSGARRIVKGYWRLA